MRRELIFLKCVVTGNLLFNVLVLYRIARAEFPACSGNYADPIVDLDYSPSRHSLGNFFFGPVDEGMLARVAGIL